MEQAMPYQVSTERHSTTTVLDGTIYVLTGPGCRAEVWPACGFNCFRWQQTHAGRELEVLYADPQLFAGSKSTRSGVPILFPFPNRIRAGRFQWAGKDYQLPLNDPSGKNAIHGFPCRHPWRVVGQGADATSAWVTGEFVGSTDAPEARALWPADYRLRVTYRLLDQALRIEAEVTNPDQVPLPFGLGYHPYFRVPLLPGDDVQHYWVESAAREFWQLTEDGVPTSERRPVAGQRDLTRGKRFTELNLDDLFTDLETPAPGHAGELCWRAGLRQAPANLEVQLLTSPTFRELVLYTPPHRAAIALEPYTCASDAINLQQRGIDAGLQVLPPGQQWHGVVEFALRGGA
jgi:aldose 1-epimerase